ncbi:non-specific lipid-transfer protein-like [Lycium barbarum]|uniref:non-specific lipid-transfer protein-like n=1 Tax=Lycium barbarum TaxID=112863 RepID=UPI00293EFDF1|nr:non-specific lipid-transfer protein-like [Lycium barbarum]
MARFLVYLSLALLISTLLNQYNALSAPSCQTVTSQLSPCLSYIRKDGAKKVGDGPSVPCCTGVNNIYQLAKTKPDRVVICNCLKTVLINLGNNVIPSRISGLPKKCGVSFNMPPLDKNYDCNKVPMY